MNATEQMLCDAARADMKACGTASAQLPEAVQSALPAGARLARLEAHRRREERLQMLLFGLAVLVMLALCAAAFAAWQAGADMEGLWCIPVACMALLALMGPFMGYMREEESDETQ
jgi:fatty acid desaturase